MAEPLKAYQLREKSEAAWDELKAAFAKACKTFDEVEEAAKEHPDGEDEDEQGMLEAELDSMGSALADLQNVFDAH